MVYNHRRSKQAKERRRTHALKTVGLPLYHQKNNLNIFRLTNNVEYTDSFRLQLVKQVGYCVLCGYNDVNALEVHHIDGNHSNNSWANVTVVCANCHTLITKRKLNYWVELTQKNLKTRKDAMILNADVKLKKNED